jgi:hypothetical protein
LNQISSRRPVLWSRPHMSVTPAPLFYTTAPPNRDPAPPLVWCDRWTPLSPCATGTPLSSSHRVAPLLTGPPCKRVPHPPFFSLSLTTLSSPGEARCAPFHFSPLRLVRVGTWSVLEAVDRHRPPPPRSSSRRATPVDLRCRLHFDEHRAGALLLPDLQVNASEPLRLDCATALKETLPHHPIHHLVGARPPLVSCAAILLARRPPLTILVLTALTALHGRHRQALATRATVSTPATVTTPRARRLAQASRATAAWPWATSTGRRPASGHRASRPPRPIGFSRGPKAGPALCTLFLVFQFHLQFQKFD